jgi:hypothetical protein
MRRRPAFEGVEFYPDVIEKAAAPCCNWHGGDD